MSWLEMCNSTSLSREDLIYESRKTKQIHKYIVNVVSIDLVGDPGTQSGNDDYFVLHSPRIPSTASHNYPSKVTPKNLL